MTRLPSRDSILGAATEDPARAACSKITARINKYLLITLFYSIFKRFCQEQIGPSLKFSSLNLNLIVASKNIAAKWRRGSGRPPVIAAAPWSGPIASESRLEKFSVSLLEQEVMLLIIS